MDLANMNTEVLKVPLGFIRVIEFPMAILAFATTSGYSDCVTYTCAGGKKEETCWGYSFSMDAYVYCNKSQGVYLFSESYKSQAEFFVFTGVIAFLYILAILFVYLFKWGNYENDHRFALGDFIGTAVLTLFWFASSCAWANGVSNVKHETSHSSINNVLKTLGFCTDPNGCIVNNWSYASLNVSLIAGFACFGLWAANLWFIYKETAWFKARQPGGGQMPPPQGTAAGMQPGYPQATPTGYM